MAFIHTWVYRKRIYDKRYIELRFVTTAIFPYYELRVKASINNVDNKVSLDKLFIPSKSYDL